MEVCAYIPVHTHTRVYVYAWVWVDDGQTVKKKPRVSERRGPRDVCTVLNLEKCSICRVQKCTVSPSLSMHSCAALCGRITYAHT